ncbi:YtzH-like family protein [Terribacillus sp. DMT04]|uniref:YtzH-like family protein n=1 Tax=Terribacillus sp. DMT04 TaxID=2850441 RepID=UPI001C2B9B6A|nr:YtzH-like family protein [Terribacillus sp. DMT04]QXE00739.1 YtzH-like family protein [Terribacillus sp. DMT04]
MSLSVDNQLGLLRDILSEHCESCCGSKSECEQISRLARSILSNKSSDQHEILAMLPGIHSYSSAGEKAADINAHITTNRGQLENWVETIDSLQG